MERGRPEHRGILTQADTVAKAMLPGSYTHSSQNLVVNF